MLPPEAFDRRAIPAAAREGTWTAPDGHSVRRLDWPEPAGAPRGAILFLPGRGDFYEKYLETFEHWRRQGWQVTAADWRGQAGSGRLGGAFDTGHVDDFALWVSDLAALWADWSHGRRGPRVLAGHSMGGHIVLRAAVDRVLDPAPEAVLLSVPMLDVRPERVPLALRRALAWAQCRRGDPCRPAWRWSERPGELPPGRQALLTHDDDRYADELWWRSERPWLGLGPGSWGWVAAALASTARLEHRGVLEAVDFPALILAAEADRLVGIRAIRRAAARLPRAELVAFGPEARHEILRERDAVRQRALDAIDRFLERV